MPLFYNILEFCFGICTFYLLYNILVSLFYKNPSKLDKNNIKYIKAPKVSVIIPAWNEEKGIAKTIKSIYQDGYLNTEIIIVDDGSTDNTFDIANKTCQKLYLKNPTIKYKIVRQPNMGKAEALNKGIKQSNGKYILTVDADSRIMAGTILKLVRPLEKYDIDVAIGKIIIGNVNNVINKSQSYEYLLVSLLRKGQNVLKSIYIFPGPITMFSKKKLIETGCYNNNSITEDFEISIKLKMNKSKVVYVDDAICVTEGASSFFGLLSQRIRWRHGYIQSLSNHNDFLFSSKKGLYLTFIDLPFNIFMIILMLFSPINWIMSLFFIIKDFSFSMFIILSYVIIMFLFSLCLKYINQEIKKIDSYWIYFVFIPFFLALINLVEFLAIAKTIYKIVSNKKTEWTVWQRTGAF